MASNLLASIASAFSPVKNEASVKDQLQKGHVGLSDKLDDDNTPRLPQRPIYNFEVGDTVEVYYNTHLLDDGTFRKVKLPHSSTRHAKWNSASCSKMNAGTFTFGLTQGWVLGTVVKKHQNYGEQADFLRDDRQSSTTAETNFIENDDINIVSYFSFTVKLVGDYKEPMTNEFVGAYSPIEQNLEYIVTDLDLIRPVETGEIDAGPRDFSKAKKKAVDSTSTPQEVQVEDSRKSTSTATVSVLMVRWYDYHTNQKRSDYNITSEFAIKSLIEDSGLVELFGTQLEVWSLFVRNGEELLQFYDQYCNPASKWKYRDWASGSGAMLSSGAGATSAPLYSLKQYANSRRGGGGSSTATRPLSNMLKVKATMTQQADQLSLQHIMQKATKRYGMYFLWPCEKTEKTDGMIEQTVFFDFVEKIEAMGIPTRWPCPARLYRKLCGKEYLEGIVSYGPSEYTAVEAPSNCSRVSTTSAKNTTAPTTSRNGPTTGHQLHPPTTFLQNKILQVPATTRVFFCDVFQNPRLAAKNAIRALEQIKECRLMEAARATASASTYNRGTSCWSPCSSPSPRNKIPSTENHSALEQLDGQHTTQARTNNKTKVISGVVKLPFSWCGQDVLKWDNEEDLVSKLQEIFGKQNDYGYGYNYDGYYSTGGKNNGSYHATVDDFDTRTSCLVQEFIPDRIGEVRVIAFNTGTTDPQTGESIYDLRTRYMPITRETSQSSFEMTDSNSFTKEEALEEMFCNNAKLCEKIDHDAKILAGWFLKYWYPAHWNSRSCPAKARFDFLISCPRSVLLSSSSTQEQLLNSTARGRRSVLSGISTSSTTADSGGAQPLVSPALSSASAVSVSPALSPAGVSSLTDELGGEEGGTNNHATSGQSSSDEEHQPDEHHEQQAAALEVGVDEVSTDTTHLDDHVVQHQPKCQLFLCELSELGVSLNGLPIQARNTAVANSLLEESDADEQGEVDDLEKDNAHAETCVDGAQNRYRRTRSGFKPLPWRWKLDEPLEMETDDWGNRWYKW
ncbi:unnamed protein product [Amoebophrya sp. A120]|nr:unnamed protein product [Amoebophrya sp. A120]|eukprot:GSA120T00019807001.1